MKRLFGTFLLLLVCLSLQAQGSYTVRRNADKVTRALYYLENRYVDSIDIDKLVDSMLASLMSELDPHSTYIPRDRVEEVNEPLDGSFEGVGIEYTMLDDTLTVQSVIVGGPAEAVGMRAGDKIIAVDGENIAGVGLLATGVRSRLRGPKGSRVAVVVLRGGEEQELVIRRDKIPLESMDAAYKPAPDIVYLKLGRFAQSSVEEIVHAMQRLTERRPAGMILDLRGNGGGFMHIAATIADMFMEEGQTIVRTVGNGIDREDKASGHGFFKEGPLIVLVDENSASASEILAGALQDWDRALIVGRRTFGKGLVQQQYDMPDGSEIRLTVARYHTPSGRVVQSPYKRGERDAYFRQAQERYERGESFSLDSIALPDSLLFHTLRLGRPVYGGGGIVPDVFVPYDTTGYNRFFVRVVGTGTLTEYVYDYLDKHREALQADDLDGFLARYALLEQDAYTGFLAFCAKRDMVPAESELAVCAPYLKTRLKALLARGPLGMNGYWQIINREEDPAFARAMKLIDQWRKTGKMPL